MTIQEIANDVVALMKEAKYEEVFAKYFTDQTISQEPEGTELGTVQGMEAIRKKGKEWNNMVEEVYDSGVSDPIVGDTYFACQMFVEFKMKGVGRTRMDELCVYHVKDGKIAKEQFFYQPAAHPEMA